MFLLPPLSLDAERVVRGPFYIAANAEGRMMNDESLI
jgi:hypothetical protein